LLFGLSGEEWLDLTQHYGQKYHLAVGSLAELLPCSRHIGKKWVGGQRE